MKKKFISVAMFSALLISTPVFVGCSDYDDDISNLQGQIDSLKGSDVSSSEALSALNNALNDLKADITTITSGKADNAAVIELQEKVTELTNLINGSGSGEGEIAGLAEQIKDLQEQVNSVKGDLDEKYNQLVKEQDDLQKKIDSLNEQIAKAATAEEVDSLKKELNKHVEEWNKVSQDVNDAATWVKNNGESLAKLTAQVTKIESLINVIYAAGEGTTIEDNEILAAIAALPTTNEDLAKLQETINGKGSEKGILGRLEDIETWKNTITEALIENKFVDGNGAASMSQALADLNWVKEQLKDGTNPDDPTILDRMNKLEENYATLAALANQVQSIVFMPVTAENPYSLISKKLVLVDENGDSHTVAVKTDSKIKFRISPASAVKDFAKNYKLTFEGYAIKKSIDGLQVSEPEINETEGTVTYTVTQAPNDKDNENNPIAWATCAKLVANTDLDENEKPINNNGTELTSNYFILDSDVNTYSNIRLNISVLGYSIEYRDGEATEASQIKLDELLSKSGIRGYNETERIWETIVLADYGLTPTFEYELGNPNDSHVFQINNGVLTAINEGSSTIGDNEYLKIKSFNIAGIKYDNSTYSQLISIIAKSITINLNESAWQPENGFMYNGRTQEVYKLPESFTNAAIEGTNRGKEGFIDLFNISTTGNISLQRGVDIYGWTGSNDDKAALYVVINAGAEIQNDTTLTLKLGGNNTDTDTYTIKLNVSPTNYDNLDGHTEKIILSSEKWANDKADLAFVATGDKDNTVLASNVALNALYTNYDALVAAANNVGADLTITTSVGADKGVSVNRSSGLINFNKTVFDYTKTPSVEVEFKITLNGKVYASHKGTLVINNRVSGKWSPLAATLKADNTQNKYQAFENISWKDYRNIDFVSWNKDTKAWVVNDNLLTAYGLSRPTIGFVQADGKTISTTDPSGNLQVNSDGVVSFTEKGQGVTYTSDVTATLRVTVNSRWSVVEGITTGNYQDITVTIPAGTK